MKRGVQHCVAKCRDCDWIDENYISARREAYKHSTKFKHIVDVEEGCRYTYGEKKND